MWSALRREVFYDKDDHVTRIENRVDVGTPDVEYCIAKVQGWIELKELDAWPKDPDLLIKVPHYTKEQRDWARKRRKVGGRIYLFLKAKQDWLLFDGAIAARAIGLNTRAQLERLAIKTWNTRPDRASLIGVLTDEAYFSAAVLPMAATPRPVSTPGGEEA